MKLNERLCRDCGLVPQNIAFPFHSPSHQPQTDGLRISCSFTQTSWIGAKCCGKHRAGESSEGNPQPRPDSQPALESLAASTSPCCARALAEQKKNTRVVFVSGKEGALDRQQAGLAFLVSRAESRKGVSRSRGNPSAERREDREECREGCVERKRSLDNHLTMSLDRRGTQGDVLLEFPSTHILSTKVSAETVASLRNHEVVSPWRWVEGESSSSGSGSSRRNSSSSSRTGGNSRRRSKSRLDLASQRYSSTATSDPYCASSSSSTLLFEGAEEEEEVHARGTTTSRRSLLPYTYTSPSSSLYLDEESASSRQQAQSRSSSHRNRRSKSNTASVQPLASRRDVASILTCARNDSWSTKRLSHSKLHAVDSTGSSSLTSREHIGKSAAAMIPITTAASGGGGYGYGAGGSGGQNGAGGSNTGGGGSGNDSGDYWYSGGDARANGSGGGRNGADGDDGPNPPPKGNGVMDEGEKARRANPLVDLIETETAYVTELGMIIKVS